LDSGICVCFQPRFLFSFTNDCISRRTGPFGYRHIIMLVY
jgi:hypothetical protein